MPFCTLEKSPKNPQKSPENPFLNYNRRNPLYTPLSICTKRHRSHPAANFPKITPLGTLLHTCHLPTRFPTKLLHTATYPHVSLQNYHTPPPTHTFPYKITTHRHLPTRFSINLLLAAFSVAHLSKAPRTSHPATYRPFTYTYRPRSPILHRNTHISPLYIHHAPPQISRNTPKRMLFSLGIAGILIFSREYI